MSPSAQGLLSLVCFAAGTLIIAAGPSTARDLAGLVGSAPGVWLLITALIKDARRP